MKRKIVFLTGTRADYGKLKSLIRILADSADFEPYVFATGMHMLPKYGSTYMEIEKDGFPHLEKFVNQDSVNLMDETLARTIQGFRAYVAKLCPDAIVVHGDRLEALAGAIVGAFNNIKVMHVEGGEVSGTIDESIRHAVSKFAHYHFVANEDAKRRLMQLGEPACNIIVFGSPDIDVMYSASLPSIESVKDHYDIEFDRYSICLYHPVTTELDCLEAHVAAFADALVASGRNYVVIYPNNDAGSDIVLKAYNNKLAGNAAFRLFPSVKFEAFLSLLKHSDMIVGNSSSGIREASVYGIPAVDVGTRQEGRYDPAKSSHIVHADETESSIRDAIAAASKLHVARKSPFGDGRSDLIFLSALRRPEIWSSDVQKRFVDIDF